MQESVDYELIAGLKLRPEEHFIINSLRTKLCAENDDEFTRIDLSTIDWKVVYEKSMQWGVAPLLYKCIKEQSSLLQSSDIPDYFLRKIKIAYLATFLANEKIFKGLGELLKVFNKAGIKVVLLKGSHVAQFTYQDIGVRPMSDIDIMVKTSDLDKVEKLLFQDGYNYMERKQATYDWYKKQFNVEGQANIIKWCKANGHQLWPFSNSKRIKKLEIHMTIDRINSPFSIDMAGIWKRLSAVQMYGVDTLIFSPEDLLLHLSLHVSHQHKFRAHGLRPFCDIAAVISHYEHEIDWKQLQVRAHKWQAEKYIYISLRLSQEILGARVAGGVLRSLKPALFNEKITLQASKRILSLGPVKPPFKGMRDRARIVIFHPDDSILRRASYFLKKVFISREDLAARYSVPPSSKRIYFFYFVRFILLLYSYIPPYSSYFLYRLVHKKDYHCNYNLDLWLRFIV